MKKEYREFIKQLGANKVKTKIPLGKYTTFKIGGPADLFYETNTPEEIEKIIKLAGKLKIPYFVLGNGSDILIADSGFRGLVIKNKLKGITKLKNSQLKVASGTTNQELLNYCQKNGLSGVEFLAGIPGTVGGSLAVNAGTPQEPFFGGSIDDVVKNITLLFSNGKVKRVSKKWMEFGYRTSKIKKVAMGKKPIILSTTLQLQESSPKDIQKVIEIKIKKKKATQPWGFSAGSIFKNPENNYAGMLIDKSGLKGKRIGGAVISDLHANFILNQDNASANDIYQLIKLVKKEVKDKFEIELELEIELIGF